MKCERFVLTLVLAALPLAAHAEEKGKGAAPTSGGGDTSEDNRLDKRWMASLEILGVATPIGVGSALRGGYYLNSDSVVEVALAGASIDKDDESSDFNSDDDDLFSSSGQYEAKRDGIAALREVHYKHFVTNSFYWTAGVADRVVDAAMYVHDTKADTMTKVASVKYHDLGAVGQIGNQWQWDYFTMGCDWIGLYIPMARMQNKYDDQDVDLSYSSDMEEKRKDFKTAYGGVTGQGLRFYLGASW